MIENKDPEIKLFGKKILFPGEVEAGEVNISPVAMDVEEKDEYLSESENEQEVEIEKDHGSEKHTEKKKEVVSPPNDAETKINKNSAATTLAEGIQNPKTPSINEEISKSENEQSEPNNNTQEKTLKKPDKLLPCPRCNSMDTKFCYYNNYNVNQPRYFCKACQRYWTVGGAMRNVPVGAGRRKNKNSLLHYRHITISEALEAARIISPNGTHHLQNLKNNGRVLSFGLDHDLPSNCGLMENVLNSNEVKGFNGTRNNGDHCSSASSMEESGKNMSHESLPKQNNGFLSQVSCMTNVPWPYPWSSGVIPSPQTLYPQGFPFPFYPSPFWNCGVPGNWNVPWLPSPTLAIPARTLTLGKHARDVDDDNDDKMAKQDNMQREESPKGSGCVLVPKTLRIDDPNEAAKSSIWETLGIKNESVSKGGMIKAFESKKEEKQHVEASPLLMANPAALARSLNFHENS